MPYQSRHVEFGAPEIGQAGDEGASASEKRLLLTVTATGFVALVVGVLVMFV